jgi:hypothetical protein
MSRHPVGVLAYAAAAAAKCAGAPTLAARPASLTIHSFGPAGARSAGFIDCLPAHMLRIR